MVLDRKSPPAFAKEFSFALPTHSEFQISNGLNGYWIKCSQDIVKIDFIYSAGKWYEPKPGIAYFTAQMLEKGSADYTALQISEILDYQGAQLEIAVGADFTSISIYSLSKNLSTVLPVVLNILSKPAFPADELELLLSIYQQNLKVNNQKTSFVASKTLSRTIFGVDHPYGKSAEENDLPTIHPADLKEFYSSRFSPVAIFLTGNLSENEINQFSKQVATLPTISNSTVIENTIQSATTKSQVIKKEDSVQVSIRMGKQTITRSDRDYPGLLLLNHILGGYFGSRLMKNIREEKGLTYGIYSAIATYLHGASFSIGADVAVDKCEEAITEIKNELKRLCDEPISVEELTVAKNHFLGSLQLEVSNPFSVTDKIKTIQLFNLGANFYSDLFDQINKTQPSDLQVLAKKHLIVDDLYTVQVG
jgi:zinc protease